MSPESQRIAIAEFCGDSVEWHDGIPYWRGEWSAVGEGNERFAEFDPLNDLNAIHKAEKHAGFHEWRTADAGHYAIELARVAGNSVARQTATAAQRSEALLRTIGKWEGGK